MKTTNMPTDPNDVTETPRTDKQEYDEACNFDVPWSDFARQLERECKALREENARLLAWKAEQLQVESSWDCQAVGKEIGVTLGHSIRPAILPYLLKVKAELAEAMRALEGWNSFAIDAMRADPVMIERAMARDPKLRNDPALRQFITSILKD